MEKRKRIIPVPGSRPKTEIEKIVYVAITIKQIHDHEKLIKYVADELFALYVKNGSMCIRYRCMGTKNMPQRREKNS